MRDANSVAWAESFQRHGQQDCGHAEVGYAERRAGLRVIVLADANLERVVEQASGKIGDEFTMAVVGETLEGLKNSGRPDVSAPEAVAAVLGCVAIDGR